MLVKQCKFKDEEGNILGGILIDNEYVICGCCGAVFDVNDSDCEVIEVYRNWVNISDEIMGE
jgi:nitrite reductase/ring-hydroxylating ferredoxin subunit